MAITRRGFLFGSGAALGFAAATGKLGQLGELLEGTAHAALSYPGYRALVCIFLNGGCDGNNVVIPTTATGYAKYSAVRPVAASNIGIAIADMQNAGTILNPVGGVAGSYGLHPSLVNIARLFNGVDAAGNALPGGPQAAVIANVGPLVAPLTKVTYGDGTGTLPDSLFSHANQVAAWESSIANPLSVSGLVTGWGGRIADKLSVNNPAAGYPDVTSLTGVRTFGVGQSRKPFVVTTTGILGRNSSGNTTVDGIRNAAATSILGLGTGNAPADDYSDVFENALVDAQMRTDAVTGNPLPADVAALFPTTDIGKQMKQICQEMLAGAATGGSGLGMKRESFIASIGSFDTHHDQLATQANLLGDVDDAVGAFYQAIALLNDKQVNGLLPNLTGPLQATMFTMSDFCRTFKPNSNLGTDHAWGNHMLVIGDQVVGGKIYGTFPDLTLGGNNDEGDEGRWIPTTPVEKYAWTLARWMGVTNAQQPYVFPNAVNFLTGTQTVLPSMGFMKA